MTHLSTPMTRLAGTTPFPNVLLDRVMPYLGDTEWRVLCVIVRQTFGWQKAADWLSHGQLKTKTGRESAAVSRAIDTLVKRGLILVQDGRDNRLHSSSERRRSRSRLVFAVHPRLVDSVSYRERIGFGHFDLRISRTENNKSNDDIKKETSGESNA